MTVPLPHALALVIFTRKTGSKALPYRCPVRLSKWAS
jgi:hypothetical protein